VVKVRSVEALARCALRWWRGSVEELAGERASRVAYGFHVTFDDDGDMPGLRGVTGAVIAAGSLPRMTPAKPTRRVTRSGCATRLSSRVGDRRCRVARAPDRLEPGAGSVAFGPEPVEASDGFLFAHGSYFGLGEPYLGDQEAGDLYWQGRILRLWSWLAAVWEHTLIDASPERGVVDV
jgi:hypothetical protein